MVSLSREFSTFKLEDRWACLVIASTSANANEGSSKKKENPNFSHETGKQ